MPTGSLGRRALVATVLHVVIAAASACVFDPPVRCEEPLRADECDRAVEMAKPLLAAYWDQAIEVLVHINPCPLNRHGSCPPRLAADPGWITVELESDPPPAPAAHVVIDRHGAEWTARCGITVFTANGAHGEPCGAP